MDVGHIVARAGSSRLVFGPCILCSLRSGVALAPEILFFAPLSIVTKQEPQKTKLSASPLDVLIQPHKRHAFVTIASLCNTQEACNHCQKALRALGPNTTQRSRGLSIM